MTRRSLFGTAITAVAGVFCPASVASPTDSQPVRDNDPLLAILDELRQLNQREKDRDAASLKTREMAAKVTMTQGGIEFSKSNPFDLIVDCISGNVRKGGKLARALTK